jgi:deoxyribodipyrimidine photo-lyase
LTVVRANGGPNSAFAPFRNAWKALPAPTAGHLLPAPRRLRPAPDLHSAPLPSPAAPSYFCAGEGHARETLRAFTSSAIFGYSNGRVRLDDDGTSALSPYLRFGMLSARAAVVAAHGAMQSAPHPEARRSAEAWLTELIWREYYSAILYHFPDVLQQAHRPKMRDITWQNNADHFAAWREGRTGYPVVDAAMRQLTETGWMHNRARMIVASFLVKDLLIDWRWGEQWFMQQLVDGDPAANNGGWQWTAGVGAAAAPYFRVFSPTRQARKCDPEGDFVRAWLPALRRVPDDFIHEPWTMPDEVQRRSHCRIGQDYPAPIVDHAVARQRALSAFRAQRPAG